jgi:hypothetical protein
VPKSEQRQRAQSCIFRPASDALGSDSKSCGSA